MSNKIDNFIRALVRGQADELLFATGRTVRLRTGTSEKTILESEVRTEQIDKLVTPLLSPDDAARFQAAGEGNFFYDSPDGRVRVSTRRRGAMVAATITLANDDAPPAEDDAGPAMLEGFESGRFAEDARAASATPEVAVRTAPARGLTINPALRADPSAAEPEPPVRLEVRPAEAAAPPRAAVRAVEAPMGPVGNAAINRILGQLVRDKGSDLHLTANHRPKMRKDGDILDLAGWDVMSGEQIQQWMFEVAPKRIREQFVETNDADYAHEIPGVARFRMNIFKDRLGTSAVIRIIPSKVLTADELNLPPVIRTFCTLPKGMVLVTGPTGSGKSTTLAAMIDLINKTRSDHIITIEDPVEFVHSSQSCLVNQREVHTHTESFARALRAALREDPDIVLVGEMRDLETVHIAIETSETGHLVFGTLHTNTAPSTVDRIIDQFPTDRQAQIRVMLSESLRGVVSQTLCKKIGGGRIACLEILVVNAAISNLIREAKTFQIPSIMQTGKAIGMQTQTDAMLELVRGNKVTPLEAYTKAVDQGLMKSTLERNGYRIDAK